MYDLEQKLRSQITFKKWRIDHGLYYKFRLWLGYLLYFNLDNWSICYTVSFYIFSSYSMFFRSSDGILNSGLAAAILTREGGSLNSFTIHDLIGKSKKEEQRKNLIIIIQVLIMWIMSVIHLMDWNTLVSLFLSQF